MVRRARRFALLAGPCRSGCPRGTPIRGAEPWPRRVRGATPSSSSTGRPSVLDGHVLVDAHVHVPVLGSLRPVWLEWRGRSVRRGCSRSSGTPTSAQAAGVGRHVRRGGRGCRAALLRVQPQGHRLPELRRPVPIVEHNPVHFRPVANVNPHLRFPIADEVRRQLDLGAAALKLHPVHGGFRCDDPTLYPRLPGARGTRSAAGGPLRGPAASPVR